MPRGLCVVRDLPATAAAGPDAIDSAFAAACAEAALIAAGDLALIAVLANPAGADVPLNDFYVRRSLLGGATTAPVSGVVVVHEREHAADWRDQEEALCDGDEELLAQVVASAAAEGRIPSGAYQWVEVFELHAFTGMPAIARELFAGRRDQWFGVQLDGLRLHRRRCPRAA